MPKLKIEQKVGIELKKSPRTWQRKRDVDDVRGKLRQGKADPRRPEITICKKEESLKHGEEKIIFKKY